MYSLFLATRPKKKKKKKNNSGDISSVADPVGFDLVCPTPPPLPHPTCLLYFILYFIIAFYHFSLLTVDGVWSDRVWGSWKCILGFHRIYLCSLKLQKQAETMSPSHFISWLQPRKVRYYLLKIHFFNLYILLFVTPSM